MKIIGWNRNVKLSRSQKGFLAGKYSRFRQGKPTSLRLAALQTNKKAGQFIYDHFQADNEIIEAMAGHRHVILAGMCLG